MVTVGLAVTLAPDVGEIAVTGFQSYDPAPEHVRLAEVPLHIDMLPLEVTDTVLVITLTDEVVPYPMHPWMSVATTL